MFEKGHKKLGGRKKGTRNGSDVTLYKIKSWMIQNYTPTQMRRDFNQLTPSERINAMIKLMPKETNIEQHKRIDLNMIDRQKIYELVNDNGDNDVRSIASE